MSRPRAGLVGAAALVAIVTTGSAVAAAGQGGKRDNPDRDAAVHVDRSDRYAEQVRRVPITRKRGRSPKAVISLPPEKVGELLTGDRLEGGGEGQLSVCLKPNPRHTSKRDDCSGRLYGFNPRIDAYLALADSRDAAKPRQVVPLTRKVKRTCTQKQPDRNHHCVLTVPFGGIDIRDPRALGCAPSSCRINLIMSAWHKRAKPNNYAIVGGMSDGKIEHQNRGSVAVARYRPGAMARPRPLVDRSFARQRMPLAEGDVETEVVYSVPVRDLRAGEALVVDGRYAAAIDHLPYPVRTRTQLVFGSSPTSLGDGGGTAAAKLADTPTELDQQNNFNCTGGRSGHRSPCPIRKVGVLRVKRSTDRTFYVNLIAGHGALPNSIQKFRESHVAKPTRGGYLKVWRYRR